MVLELDIDIGRVTILNIYNPRGESPQLREWLRIEMALEEA